MTDSGDAEVQALQRDYSRVLGEVVELYDLANDLRTRASHLDRRGYSRAASELRSAARDVREKALEIEGVTNPTDAIEQANAGETPDMVFQQAADSSEPITDLPDVSPGTAVEVGVDVPHTEYGVALRLLNGDVTNLIEHGFQFTVGDDAYEVRTDSDSDVIVHELDCGHSDEQACVDEQTVVKLGVRK